MKKVLLIIIFILAMGVYTNTTQAYGECSEYGVMVMYDSYANTCKCMSGYVFSSKYGTTQCVSANSICYDKYGYNSTYDSSSNSCECSYGYIFGKDSIGRTQCVSPDSICKDQLGYNARYNTLSDKCECGYGYVISGGSCKDADSVCHSNHGYNSEYNDSNNSCECDNGYIFDKSNQCVQKQNNIYFILKELNTDERKAIIKSDYDYRYYLISYNSGCYASSFRRYLNHQIVVNLGTDLYLDTWDKIVLQDDNESCDITRKEYADSSTTLEPKEEQSYYIAPKPVAPIQTPIIKPPQIPKQIQSTIETGKYEGRNIKEPIEVESVSTEATTSSFMSNESTITNKISFIRKTYLWVINIFK